MLTEQNKTIKQEESRRGEALYWAAVLIWAGLVFGAENLGALPQVGGMDAWNWVFFGAGLLALVGCIRRLSSPDRAHPTTWDYVWAGVLMILGLSGLTTLEIGFPLILLLIGVALLATTLMAADERRLS
jgi:hypothetical protein